MDSIFSFAKLMSFLFYLNLFLAKDTCAQISIDTKRRQTIDNLVNAIKNNDTILIARLIDTAKTFDMYSKELSMRGIRKLSKKLSNNELIYLYPNSTKIIEERSFGTRYQVILYSKEDRR